MKRILPVERAFAAFESLTSDERQQFSAMVAGFMRGKGVSAPAAPRADGKKRKAKEPETLLDAISGHKSNWADTPAQ